ncbi:MAG: NAD(P)/FAD-dependent oxidoreductase [Bacteroides sp.]|nr:NAD(P)/FAD-dependent oxidoreductase [Bacteroides sp.]
MHTIDIPDKGNRQRVVIIGGGFGGLKLAKKLKSDRFQVVLIDKNNYHLFVPLLYQVATAAIEPSAIFFPFRKIFRDREDFHVRICVAERVVPEQNVLETSIGALEYDYLVIATGSSSNYFGNDQLPKTTMALKDTSEALYNRNKILESFELAQNTVRPEEIDPLMTFVIVGGGPTGVELAGALAEMRNYILPKDYPDLDLSRMHIVLVDAGTRLLSAFQEKSSQEAQKYLEKKGVKIQLNTRVENYENGQLILGDKSTLSTANVFWVGGVQANGLEGFPKEVYGHGNRLQVDEYSRVKGYQNIFAIGDTSLMTLKDYPKGHPQLVQPAQQQGARLADNLYRLEKGKSLQPFVYHNRGIMATIGRNHAEVELPHPNIRFGGFMGWTVWLFIHLMNTLGVKNKIFVFFDWVWSYFTRDPSLRLIIKPLVKGDAKDEHEKDPDSQGKKV